MNQAAKERESFEAVAEQFTEQHRRGERPSIEEYVDQYPEFAEEIHELFPTIAAIERMKEKGSPDSRRSSLSAASMPDRLGDFRIIREIGRGGMGIVYEAEQQSLGRRVAVKVLPQHSLLNPVHLGRFEREARTAANLHHTNIVPVFGVGEDDGLHYYVMQYIRGVGLNCVIAQLAEMPSDTKRIEAHAHIQGAFLRPATGDSVSDSDQSIWIEDDRAAATRIGIEISPEEIYELDSEGKLANPLDPTVDVQAEIDTFPVRSPDHSDDEPTAPTGDDAPLAGLGRAYWRSVAKIGMQLADALQYAHDQGTLHRDIKPANLILDARGIVWIADFGLAKAAENDGLSTTGNIVGTLRYMAPENLSGEADERSDIYSLGLTLYELVTLRPAFEDADSRQLLHLISHVGPVAPRKVNREIPTDLETILLKAISREPSDRYASGQALAADLQNFLEDRPLQARKAMLHERLIRWSRRNPALAGLAGVSVMLLFMVAMVASLAYARAERDNRLIRQALSGETHERERAEASSELALEALDKIYEQFAPNRFSQGSSLTVQLDDGEDFSVSVQPAVTKENAALLENLLGFYDRLASQQSSDQQGMSDRLRRESARANRRVGDIRQRIGQYEQAETAYQRALSIYESLAEENSKDAELRVAIARIHNEIGNLHRADETRDASRASHTKALSTLQSIAKQSSTVPAPAQYELARTYYLMARRPRPEPDAEPPHPGEGPHHGDGHRGPPGGPREGHGPGDHKNGPPRHAPARRGPPGRAGGDFGPDRREPPPHRPGQRCDDSPRNETREEVARAITVLEGLVKSDPQMPEYRYLLACCYRELPPEMGSRHRGLPEGMEKKSIEMFQALVDEFPGVPEFRYELSETYSRVDEHRPPGQEEVEEQIERRLMTAQTHAEKLVADHPSVPDYTLLLAHIHHKLGSILRRMGRFDEAEVSYRRAVSLQSKVIQQLPDQQAQRTWLAIIQQSLARLLRETGQYEEAVDYLRASVVGLKDNSDRTHSPHDAGPPEFAGPLVDSYRMLADLLERLGDQDEAAEAQKNFESLRGNHHRPPGHRGPRHHPHRERPPRGDRHGPPSPRPEGPL